MIFRLPKHNQEKLIFLHIPKTGGSTLGSIIHRQYGRKSCFTVRNNRDAVAFNMQSQAVKQTTKVLMGHMAFGHHLAFESARVRYITMLRHPVDRIISNYFFILNRPNHRLHRILKKNVADLCYYVSSGVVPNAENAQVRLLANCIDKPHGACTREDLEMAKKCIRTDVDLAGCTDLFDEFIVLASSRLGWNMAYYAPKNITKGRVKSQDLDARTVETILRYNDLDLKLYEYCRQLFMERWNSELLKNERRLHIFKRQNSFIGKLIKIKRDIF